MTQQRDAQEDLRLLGQVCSGNMYSIFEYWIKEAEAQRERADRAEKAVSISATKQHPTMESYMWACEEMTKYMRWAWSAWEKQDKLQEHLEHIYDLFQDETTGHASAAVMQYIDSIKEGNNTDG